MSEIESDICILGAGLTGALAAEKLSRLKPRSKIVLVDAGRPIFDSENRMEHRERYLKYAENPFPGDYLSGQFALNSESQSMSVGGWAMHWAGESTRFSEEDLGLHSRYGIATDWPIGWADLEKYYCEAEHALGVNGEPSPYMGDRRSRPYPMPPMPHSYSLKQIKDWAEASGTRTNILATARNTVSYDGRPGCVRCDTCMPICPIGARYSPDFSIKKLIENKRVQLVSNVLVRRLVLSDTSNKIVLAEGRPTGGDPDSAVSFRSKVFILALNKYWTPHLMLLSACDRFPNGVGNSSGLVGKHMSGWRVAKAKIKTDRPIFHGMHNSVRLESREFYRCKSGEKYLRHGMLFGTTLERPKLRSANGTVRLGDEFYDEWRAESNGLIELWFNYELHGAKESGIILDNKRRNRWGDPMPLVQDVMDEKTKARLPELKEHFDKQTQRFIRAGGGKVASFDFAAVGNWRSGGCRMGETPTSAVCDSFGRTFDHENLFLVGSPTMPTSGFFGETLMYAALTLRSANEISHHV